MLAGRMDAQLREDVEVISRLPFQQDAKRREIVERAHAVQKAIEKHRDNAAWRRFYPWILAPRTLWPLDILGLGKHALLLLESGKRLGPEMTLLLDLLGDPPNRAIQDDIVVYERLVADGRYETLIKCQAKFDELERELRENTELLQDWSLIKKRFDVSQFRNRKGVVRRTMVQERNFRTGWDFSWKSPQAKFQALFDAFCNHWNLYGMEYDKPLLIKLTVNLTPHGLMVFIPKYWSFDCKRDVNWRAVTKLHRVRRMMRQGPKLSENRLAKRQERAKATALWKQATSDGLRGSARIEWVNTQLGWRADTDKSKLMRLLH